MNRTPSMNLRPTLLPWVASLALIGASPWAQAGGTQKINDTGALSCFVNKQLTTDCAGTRQDADFGRDVVMPDDGDGKAGFSFRKVCNNGDFAGTGTCPADPPLGAGPQDWGCTHDRVTKLTWEIKTTDGGVRDVKKLYSNYSDGRTGDTGAFVTAVNQEGLCGRNDWRMPKVSEMLSIVDYGSKNYIDSNWFPNPIMNRAHWSGEKSISGNFNSWYFDGMGQFNLLSTAQKIAARLVRGGRQSIEPSKRYVISAEETVDLQSGLAWKSCAEFPECVSARELSGGQLRFAEALKVVAEISKSTGQRWRIPNIKELDSWVMRDDLDTVYVPAFGRGGYNNYMSSTPSINSNAMVYLGMAIFELGESRIFNNPNNSKGVDTNIFLVRNFDAGE